MNLAWRNEMEGVVVDGERCKVNIMLAAPLLKKENLIIIMPMWCGEIVALVATVQRYKPEGEIKVIANWKVVGWDRG